MHSSRQLHRLWQLQCLITTACGSYSVRQLQLVASTVFVVVSVWQHLRSTATACDRHGVRLLRQLQCSTTAARGSYSISSTFDWQFQLVAATAFDSHSTWPLQCSIAVTLDSRPYSHLAAPAYESHSAIVFDSCGTLDRVRVRQLQLTIGAQQ